MGVRELFLLRREEFEGFALNRVLIGLSDEQIRRRPHPATSSIAWLLWHIARGEDWAASRVLMDQPQLLHTDGWQRQLGLSLERVGTGMTLDEVTVVSEQVNLAALQDYYAAVRGRLNEVAAALSPEEWDAVPDQRHLRQVVFEEGLFGDPGAPPAWLAGAYEQGYRGKPRGWFLTLHGLTHPYEHLGEAGVLRSLLLHQDTP